jgi:hypothetical protein
MNTPAAALAWELWWGHRWGLAAAGAVVAGFAAYSAAVPLTGQFASVSSIWFVMGLCYVIGVFAYGSEARLEAAESGFPARLFVLPVRTPVLVGWPMLQGVAAAVLMWVAWDALVLRPAGVETPGWWVAMLAAAVAVSQALVWLPFGVPGVRIVVLVTAVTLLIRAPAVLALFGDRFADPDAARRALVAFPLALIPAAFLLAVVGVARARRGDGTAWSPLAAARESPQRRVRRTGEARPFASALRAQTWYEWRLRGRPYVGSVAAVVAALVLLALLNAPAAWADFAPVLLSMPLLLACQFGAVFGSPGDSVRSSALSAFAATRPLDNATLVRAKVRAAAWATAAAWAVALAMTAAWLTAVGGFGKYAAMWDMYVARHGRGTVIGVAAVTVAMFLFGTWRALVANLWVGLTGRTWLVPVQALLTSFVVLSGLAEWVAWDSDPVHRERVASWLPGVAAALVAAKLLAAAGLLRAAVGRGQTTPRAAGVLAAVWLVAAAGLFALLVRIVPHDRVPVYGLALAAVLFVPLARPAAAPLALAWNRHR